MGKGALRNKSCHCESAKKYSDCCFDFDTQKEKLKECSNSQYDRMPILGRPIISTIFKGKRVVAVGSRVYRDIPINETFHEFLIRNLQNLLGRDWIEGERKKSARERHHIVQGFDSFYEDRRRLAPTLERPEKSIKSLPTSGNVLAMLTFAYDVYSVQHCAVIPDDILQRLKQYNEYQGARYEINVAGTCVRAGFVIDWIRPTQGKIGKECEFVAYHPRHNEFVVVEAKSRQRSGVLHRDGAQSSIFIESTADINQLYKRAVAKSSHGLPLVVFIDINLLPNENSVTSASWVYQLRQKFADTPIMEPEKHSLLFITNYSWHYKKKAIASTWAEKICIIPHNSIHPIQNKDAVAALADSVKGYGGVPPLFPDQ